MSDWDWAAAPAPLRRCGTGQVHRRRGDPRRHRVLGILCRKWCCATCGPYLKRTWKEHLACQFHSAADAGFDLYATAVDESGWETTRKAIQRGRSGSGGYVRVLMPGDASHSAWLAAISTAPVGEMVSAAQAVELIGKLLDAVPFDRQRMSKSRSWKLPPRETGNWERVGRAPHGVDAAAVTLRSLGMGDAVVVVPFAGDGDDKTRAVEFEVPIEWLDEGSAAYENLLDWLELGGSPDDDATLG